RSLDGLGGGGVAEPVRDQEAPVPVSLRVGLGVHLREQNGGVDVALLVSDAQIQLQIGPVIGEGVQNRLERVGEAHPGQPTQAPARGADVCVRDSRMRRSRPQPTPGESRPRGLLVTAAAGFGVLWVCVVVLAAVAHSGVLAAVGAVGTAGTLALLPLVRRRDAELEGLSRTDPLTGLANHRGFHQALSRELERARGKDGRLAVVMLDVDNFKAVNHAHGHPYGDEVLRSIGKSLRIATGGAGMAARIGGEEFALIAPDQDAERAYQMAERARDAVSAVSVRGIELSCSAGVAAFPDDAEDPSSLCQLAEGALHWAKRHGKGRTRRFDPGHVPLGWTSRRAGEVEALLASDHPITPVFQPVVALASGHLVGYEALARFTSSPKRSPEAWFAQAHGCGLGPDLEAAAISAALEPVGRPLGTHLAINVSPSALTSAPVIRSLPTDLSGIVIEITEHEF